MTKPSKLVSSGMQLELCLKNPTPHSSPASEVKPEVPPAPPLPDGMESSVVGRNGRVYYLKSGAHKRHELYPTWKSMRERCLRPTHKDFTRYGGRGITICERWNNFETFVSDMGPRPTSKHSIDRIDGNGNYEPKNCRWATQFEQMQHTNRNRFLTKDGETRTASEWARKLNMSPKLICERKLRGWSDEQVLSPVKLPPGNGKRAWATKLRNIQERAALQRLR